MNNIEIGEPFLSWTETITEPEFEFDESDLHSSIQCTESDIIIKDQVLPEEVKNINANSIFFDHNLEENYEDQILKYGNSSVNLIDNDMSKYNIINVSGDDKYGRKIISISACNLPDKNNCDYYRFSKYIKDTLDKYVEIDYVLIYFHFGLTGKNKPPISWLWHMYKIFDRNYKKNLKQLYLVHPTNFVKIIYQLFKKAISSKFGDKIVYVKTLRDLQSDMYVDQLYIPKPVLEHDNELYLKYKLQSYPLNEQLQTQLPDLSNRPPGSSYSIKDFAQIPPTPQRKLSNISSPSLNPERIHLLINELIRLMSNNETLGTVGIFRRSCSRPQLKLCKTRLYNEGCSIIDITKNQGDEHLRAVLLKTLFRDLPEPIIGLDNYERICQTDVDEQDLNFCLSIVEQISTSDFKLLKTLIKYLALVSSFDSINLMNSKNLGLIFGPNLVWSHDQPSLQDLYRINSFVTLLIDKYSQIFTDTSNILTEQ